MSEQIHEYPCAKCGVNCSEWNHGGFMPNWKPLCRSCVDSMKTEGVVFQPYLETRQRKSPNTGAGAKGTES